MALLQLNLNKKSRGPARWPKTAPTLRPCLLATTPLLLVLGLFWATTAVRGTEADHRWDYPDPLVSTTPTNFHPADRRDLRPTRSDEDYNQLADTLRAAYANPPEDWPEPNVEPGIDPEPMGLPRPAEFPEDNPHTDAKAELGKLLFFDGRLSGSGQMSCASCHIADLGWADGRARSLGHGARQLQRNTPSLLNTGFQPHYFWDGREESIESLIKSVLTNDTEMRTTPEEATERIAAVKGYADHFEAAFGDAKVTFDRIARAIATHVRTITSEASSDFDRFIKGDHDRLSDAAIRGLHLFRTDARCLNCHHGPELTDQQFHNLGLHYFGRKYEDLGRYYVTKQPEDVGRFKTPSLRNVSRTAPYMHVGFFNLEGLINVYNAGGARPRPREAFKDDPLWPTTSDLLVPLHLNQRDRADLEAFLESLTERRRRDMLPDLPQ